MSPEVPKTKPETISRENSASKPKPVTIEEDVKEGEVEDEEGLTVYPYERLKITSTDPVKEIDVTKREVFIQITVIMGHIHYLFYENFQSFFVDLFVFRRVQGEIWDG